MKLQRVTVVMAKMIKKTLAICAFLQDGDLTYKIRKTDLNNFEILGILECIRDHILNQMKDKK